MLMGIVYSARSPILYCRFHETAVFAEKMKKHSERRKHCALAVVKAEPKNFAPPQTPSPRSRDGQNLISWRWSLPSPTDPVW